mgnify:CR=1 FL=1
MKFGQKAGAILKNTCHTVDNVFVSCKIEYATFRFVTFLAHEDQKDMVMNHFEKWFNAQKKICLPP